MDDPVSHAECERYRCEVDETVRRLIRESETRTQREIAEMKGDIQAMAQKIDQIPWQLLTVCLVIIGAIVLLAVT